MKASIMMWLATMLFIVAGMVAIGFGAVASFAMLIIGAVLGAVFSMNLMAKEKGGNQNVADKPK